MSKTGLVCDAVFERHKTGHGHPERPQRLQAISKTLAERDLTSSCIRIEPVPAGLQVVGRNHDPRYLERIESWCKNGRPHGDTPDTDLSPESFDVALLAAGSLCRAVDMVFGGELDNAFCAVRPPGHHAERNIAMGFCLINNVAVAARHLIEHHGLTRVVILDWDVHHGNGTQHSFYDDPKVLYISLHGHPGILYPGTGYEHERGRGVGEGFTLNVPIIPPGGDAVWRAAFDQKVLPKVDDFKPEFVLISAGFDAHRLDPLGPLELETASYGWMTQSMLEAARRHCRGRLVSVLEGGYHLQALADSVSLHVEKLLAD
jgi:acetoin utilization deacetylase AcuC-like enzyme